MIIAGSSRAFSIIFGVAVFGGKNSSFFGANLENH